VDSVDFARLLVKSSLLSNSKITWVTFHGAYDFGYLNQNLDRARTSIRSHGVYGCGGTLLVEGWRG
jgi:hypothetical protein